MSAPTVPSQKGSRHPVLVFQGREIAAGWRSRGMGMAVSLIGTAVALTILGFILLRLTTQIRVESAIVVTAAAAGWLLSAREALAARGTVTRMFIGVNGAALRDAAFARIAAAGWELVEEDRTQWSGATVYHLRLRRQRRSARAEIWSHGDRSRVVLRVKGIRDPAELSTICSWFSAETGT